MIVYWMGCLLSVFLMNTAIRHTRNRRQRRKLIIASTIPMILIAAIRYDVGQDYFYTYVPYFQRVATNTLGSRRQLELLYHYLNVIVSKFSDDYTGVFAICAVIFYTAVYSQIVYASPKPWLSVYLLTTMGYVFVFFNAMRQMVGCAILLYSLRYVKERNIFRFIICVLFAFGFHKTCLLFSIVYFFPVIRIKPRLIWIITGIIAVIAPFLANISRTIILMTQYSEYLLTTFEVQPPAYVTISVNVVLLAFYTVVYQKNEQYAVYFYLQAFTLWTSILTGSIVLVMRVMWFFGLPSIISLPVALQQIRNRRNRRLITIAVVVLYCIYNIYTVGIQNSNNVLPYQTIFSR